MKIYALPTNQGTAASETMLCEDDVSGTEPLALVRSIARAAKDIDGDYASFIDVTDNDEAACVWCGRDSDENVR